MKRDETEANRRWVEQWRVAGPLLEKMRIEQLRAMTEEETRASAELVAEAVPSKIEECSAETTSGLVEQQRYFRKAPRC